MTARLASRCSTRLTHASSRPTSWEMTTRPPLWLRRKSRSQPIESASRWLVGSSSSSVSAPENRIRASSTRRRWPPESVRSGCPSTRSGKTEASGDLGRLGLGGVPAGRVQRRVGASRSAASPGRARRVVAAHLGLGGPKAATTSSSPRAERIRSRAARRDRRCADPAGGSRPSRTRDRAAAGSASPARMLGERGLAGAVAPDQADPVARPRSGRTRRPSAGARPRAPRAGTQ